MELPPAVNELDCDFGITALSGSVELPPSVAAEDEPRENRLRPRGKKRATSAKSERSSKNAQVQPTHFPLSDFCLPDPVQGDTLLSYWGSLGVELPACCGDGDEDDDFFVLERESVEGKAPPLHHVPSPLDLMRVGHLKRQVAAEYYSPHECCHIFPLQTAS